MACLGTAGRGNVWQSEAWKRWRLDDTAASSLDVVGRGAAWHGETRYVIARQSKERWEASDIPPSGQVPQ